MQTTKINRFNFSVFKIFVLLVTLTPIIILTGCGGGSDGGSNSPSSYTLTIVQDGEGTVVPAPGDYTYSAGSYVEIQATPNDGDFFYWDGDLVSGASPAGLTMNGNKTVTVHFREIPTGIQAAIDAASSGDVVVIPPGTYQENIDFKGKNITLRSLNPNDPDIVADTVIDGDSRGTVVTFSYGEGPETIIEGFTIKNGTGNNDLGITRGGGILIVDGASPTIRENVITNNTADTGGGIYVGASSAPQLINNKITANNALGGSINEGGGGIACIGSGAVVVNNNEITANAAGLGGGVYIKNSPVTLSNNIISNNNSGSSGGGVRIWANNFAPVITDNIINGNTGDSQGGGISITTYDTSFELKNNNISENTSPYGAGVSIDTNDTSRTITFEGNTFNQNDSTDAKGALYIYSNSKAAIKSNTFTNNIGFAIFKEYSGVIEDLGGNTFNSNDEDHNY